MTQAVPASARAVIVGAGIVGASVAHHRALQGWDELVVVDQGPLWETGGSTSHAPGLVFQHNASRTMTRLAQWTVEKLLEVGAYHPVGSIEVATTDERWIELDRRWGRARGFGLDARLLDPAEVASLIPLVDAGAIHGGFWVADAYAIGNYRHEPRLTEPEAIGPTAIEEFTPSDFESAREEAGRLLPELRDVELTRCFNGLMSFTPDGFPLLGHSAVARGLWLAQAIWVTHSAGCGRALAELMTHGDALLDLHECDPERFDAHGTSTTYVRLRGAHIAV